MKLQQAYFTENLTAGGWTLIGYTAPGNGSQTTNFYYGIGGIGKTTSNAVSSATVGWTASNKANLNECAKGTATAPENTETDANWKVSVQMTSGSSQSDLTFTSAAKGAGCQALTPSFDKIGL